MTTRRAWELAWLGGPLIGIANGTAREATYARRLPELRAHQLSTATGLALFAAYFSLLERRWPLGDDREAARVGALWLTLTVAFEFGFGHFVARKSWLDLLRDYDLAHGRAWGLVVAWMGAGPYITRHMQRSRHENAS